MEEGQGLVCWSRPLGATLWGALLTMVAFSPDIWKAMFSTHQSPLRRLLYATLGCPFLSHWLALRTLTSATNAKTLCMLQEMTTGEPPSPHFVLNARILASCDLWVHVPDLEDWTDLECRTQRQNMIDMLQPFLISESHLIGPYAAKLIYADSSAAIGSAPSRTDGYICRFNVIGMRALMESGLLPTHRQELEALQVVQTPKTGCAVLAAVQAGGYLLSVLLRLVQGMQVSPIEAVSTHFCCSLLFHSITLASGLAYLPRRPLLVHLDRLTWQELQLSIHNLAPPRDQADLKFLMSQELRFNLSTPNSMMVTFMVLMTYTFAKLPLLMSEDYSNLCSNWAFPLFFFGFMGAIRVYHDAPYDCPHGRVSFLPIAWMFTCITLATIGTITEWPSFSKTSWISSHWIIPHI